MRYDGLEAAELARQLDAPHCVALRTVTSTLDVVHEAAADDAPAGTVVLADEQSAGRGRQGRSWHSPAGQGVWLGYLMRPECSIEGGVLGVRVGLAVAQALGELGVAVGLKWPNDVLLQDRKLAGILCEARWHAGGVAWIAVGVGMNLHGPLPADLAARAVALDEVLPGVTRIAVLERLVPKLHRLSDRPELSEEERTTYARIDWLSGRRLVQPVSGVAGGLGADGALLVQTTAGVERIVGGSVVAA